MERSVGVMSGDFDYAKGCAFAVACVGAVLCAWVGLTDHGIYHPDEIYQTVEPAHRLVYGYGLTSWEWRVGARNWILPAVMSVGFWIAQLLGLETSPTHLVPLTSMTCGVTAVASYGVYRLVRERGGRPAAAVASTALFAFFPVTLYLGHRSLAEVWSAPLIIWGLIWTLGQSPPDSTEDDAKTAPSYVGLSLLGIAVLVRLQTAIVGLAVALVYRFRGETAAYRRAVNVFAGWAVIYGIVDFATWGVPFQSAGAYLRANVWLGVTTKYYGVSPVGTLLAIFLATGGIAAVVMVVGALGGLRRAPDLAIVAASFLIAHLLFPHKDIRFIYPVLPLLAVLTGLGADALLERLEVTTDWGMGVAAVAIIASAGQGITRHAMLTFGDFRHQRTLGVGPERSAHRFRHSVNVLLARAGGHSDLCGLFVRAPAVVETGGGSYLHRDVPIYHRLQPPPSRQTYNYAIMRQSAPLPPSPRGGAAPRIEATEGRFALVSLERPTCRPDPDYRPRVDRPPSGERSD